MLGRKPEGVEYDTRSLALIAALPGDIQELCALYKFCTFKINKTNSFFDNWEVARFAGLMFSDAAHLLADEINGESKDKIKVDCGSMLAVYHQSLMEEVRVIGSRLVYKEEQIMEEIEAEERRRRNYWGSDFTPWNARY